MVNRCAAGKRCMVMNVNMSAQQRSIGHHYMVANPAIVSNV